MDVSSFGKIGLLVSIELMLPFISFLGLERAILRFYGIKNEFKLFKKTVFVSVKISHLLLLSLLLISYFTFGNDFLGINLFPDIFLVLLLVFFQGSNLLNFNILRVNESHSIYFKKKLAFQILKFSLVLFLVLMFKSYLGYLVGSLIASVIIYMSFINNTLLSIDNQGSLDTFKKLFTFSWPFVFHGISLSLLGNADKFIMESYLTTNEVGIYTLSYIIGSSISFVFIGVSVFMEPLIYKENKTHKRERLLNKFTILTLLTGIFSYFIVGLISQFVLPHIYDATYSDILIYIPLIASAYLVFPYYLKANYRLTYNKNTTSIALVSFISSVLNIWMNIIFIPIYGIYAAVVITILSFILQSLIFIIISKKGKLFDKENFNFLILGAIVIGSLIYELAYYYSIVLYLLYIVIIIYDYNKLKNIERT